MVGEGGGPLLVARSVRYEHIPPQYATRRRVEMVSPGYSHYAPVQMGCASCGY
ncbi:hypothetical protein [Bradyrhizobium diazoefficiens]|uniref:hypothetical protein n=1 Tax=Bradyrhizobium diazoefficiens TaxID=1355477 RepID=UPI00272A2BB7|nr:hypothetical protein [Bradyrhizobium diazoefficiens]WLA69686.1 hypothetical protein QNN01_23945 [Bradyrhizobium diazoefficiens]